MDSKIPAYFWGGDLLTSPELLLAALWLRSHPGINLAGYAEISVRRFCFDTHLPPEALDRVAEALGKGLVRHGNEYWLRDFIADEFGRGPALVSNNMSAAVVKDLAGVRSPWVALCVLEEYPELSHRWNAYKEQALGKGLPRATVGVLPTKEAQGARAGAGAGEGERAGGEDRGAGERRRGQTSRPDDVAEVQTYGVSIGVPAEECAKFFDHFEANGWRQGGRTPLRSWQAALRNWARRSVGFGKNFDGSGATLERFDPNLPNAHTGGAVEG